MMKTRLSLAIALGLVVTAVETAPLAFAQNSQSGSKTGNTGSSSQGNVTTNDSALPQNDTGAAKKNERGDRTKSRRKRRPIRLWPIRARFPTITRIPRRRPISQKPNS